LWLSLGPAPAHLGARIARERSTSVPASARGPISAALGQIEPGYRIEGLRASDPAQNLRERFSSHGATVSSGTARLGIRLVAYGEGGALHRLGAVAPSVEANRVSYAHGPVTEWWANGPLGLEQGFDVHARPAGGPGPLTVSLALSGDLRARLADGSVMLQRAGARLRYGGLSASDARGRALRARFALHGAHLLIEVDTRGASFPVRIDPFVQQAELSNGAGVAASQLGEHVAVGGNTVAVGAPGPTGTNGAVYVFVEPNAGWSTTSKPTATLTEGAMAGLGMSVAVDASGDTIVAGAVPPGQVLCIGCTPTGAVYVFTRPADNVWVSSSTPAQLSPNDVASGHELGGSVAIDAAGDTIVAGAPSHKSGSNDAQGAAYVFVRPGSGVWTTTSNQTAELSAPTSGTGVGQADDSLGRSVAISGDGNTVVAGAFGYEVGTNTEQGAVYVFEKPGTSWDIGPGDIHQTSFLTASDGAKADDLGATVALSGSVLVAGAPAHGTDQQGAVYVFVEPSAGWLRSATQNAELTAQLGYVNDHLGTAVAEYAEGGTVLAGGPGEPGLASPPAAVYAFAEPAAGWPTAASNLVDHESYQLGASDAATGDSFGASIAVSGSTAVVGSPAHAVGTNQQQGTAYVFGFPSPSVTIKTPANGALYAQAASVKASYACSVTGSTIRSCSGPVANGSAIDTATPGTHTFAVTATTVDGLQASKTATYTVLAAPALSNVRQSHSRWRAGSARARISSHGKRRKTPVGTTFSFTLNERATLTFTFTYTAAGREASHKCVALTSKNKRDRKCTRSAGSLSLSAAQGAHKVSFDGRLRGSKKLAPGSYKVTIVATNSLRRSSHPKTLSFTIVS
jgi:hypothetical protein